MAKIQPLQDRVIVKRFESEEKTANEESLTEKVNFAYQEGVGIMFWEYGYDYKNILTETICREMGKLRGNN